MPFQCVEVTLVIMFSVLFPVCVYLSIKQRTWLSESRIRLGNLQVLWQEVSDSNQELIDFAKKKNIDVKMGSEERTYEDLGALKKNASRVKDRKTKSEMKRNIKRR